VGIQEAFALSFRALVPGGTSQSVRSVSLQLPKGVTVRGQSSGPMQLVQQSGGNVVRMGGISASWTLEASSEGRFVLGPVTYDIDGRSFKTRTVSVTVRKGKRKQVDPWKRLFQDFDDDEFFKPRRLVEEEIPFDPALALPKARGTQVFLHATVDKNKAILGEQVTASIFLYEEEGLPRFGFAESHEAKSEGFVRESLIDDNGSSTPKPAGRALVEGKAYRVSLVRKLALFPSKVGQLVLSPMQLTIAPKRPQNLRESETLEIDVSEPPEDGRPGDYVPGDAGQFQVGCSVGKLQDGIFGLDVDVTGAGNFPPHLVLTEAKPTPGRLLEFGEPDRRDEIGPDPKGRWAGTRHFKYTVRVQTEAAPSKVKLGKVELPYYDPETRKYNRVSCSLGTVMSDTALEKPAPGESGAKAGNTWLSDLPAPQGSAAGTANAIGRTSASGSMLHSPALLASLSGLAPLAILARWLAERRKKATAGKRQKLDLSLAGNALAEHINRTLRPRIATHGPAANSDEIRQTLLKLGRSEADADAAVALLLRCEGMRFSGAAGPDKEDDSSLRAAAKEVAEWIP
jgi:hypothetical protein